MPSGMKMIRMMRIFDVDVNGKKLFGLSLDLPAQSGNVPPLVLVKGDKGMVVSRYIDTAVAEDNGIAAAMVLDVESEEDFVDREVHFANLKARHLGVKKGMPVREALRLMA